MSNENPIPNLDNDTLTYRFSKVGNRGFTNIYNIERSINGDNFHIIGTVTKTRDADWQHSAYWSATALDGQSAGGDSRKAAVSSLEHRLQGPEYAERKRAEWQQEYNERRARRQAAEAEAAERVQVFDRSTWETPEVMVVLDNFPVARFFMTPERFDAERSIKLTYEQAMNFAESTAESLRSTILSAVLA